MNPRVIPVMTTIVVAIVVFVFALLPTNRNKENDPPPPAVTQQDTAAQVVQAPVPQVVRVGATSRPFRFGTGGFALAYLTDDVKFYPLGGTITVVHIESGRRWTVNPTISTDKQDLAGLRLGWYAICPAPGSAATVVDVWSNWEASPPGVPNFNPASACGGS